MNPSDLLGGDVRPAVAARYLQSPDRLASMLKKDVGGMGESPAAILADIINVERADTRRLAQVLDVDLDADLMSEDRAADLLAGIVDGDGIELVLAFNDLAQKRDQVLRSALDEDEYEEFMDAKTSVMHTNDPETWDEESEE